MSTRRNRIGEGSRRNPRRAARSNQDQWWRWNRSIRFHGLVFLLGTKLTDIITTVVGIRFIPAIVEANPFANGAFAEVGLITGLTVLGATSVLLATGTAELVALEIRRRYGLETTALCVQLSVYLALTLLFGFVSLHNAALIVDQGGYLLGEVLGSPSMFGV